MTEENTQTTTIAEEQVPKARFKEVYERAQAAEARAQALEAEREAQRMKDLEEQNRFKELNAELAKKNEDLLAIIEPLRSKAEQFDTYTESRRNSLLEKIPEEDRDIYGDLPLEKLEKAVTKIAPVVTPSATVNTSPQVRANLNGMKHPKDMTPKELKENWPKVQEFYKNQRK